MDKCIPIGGFISPKVLSIETIERFLLENEVV